MIKVIAGIAIVIGVFVTALCGLAVYVGIREMVADYKERKDWSGK